MASRRRSNHMRGGAQFDAPSGTLPPDVLYDKPYFSDESDLPVSTGMPLRLFREVPVASPVVRVYRGPTRRLPPAKPKLSLNLSGLRFGFPKSVRVCVSRKQRREVLFSLRKAGFSGSARKKRYRRNAFSQYGC